MSQKSTFRFICLAVLFLMVSSACLTGGTAAPATKQETTAANTNSPAAEGTLDPAPPIAEQTPVSGSDGGETFLGDYVAKSGYFFAALKLEDPAPAAKGYEAASGTRLVAVWMVFGNQTGEKLYVLRDDVKLIDSQGESHDVVSDARDGGIPGVILDQGERAQGWVAYAIPTDVQPAALEFDYDYGEEGKVKLGLTPPPEGRTARAVDTSRTPPERSKLGEAAKAGGLALTALQVEDPTDPELAIYSIGLPEGMHLGAVEVLIANDNLPGFSLATFNFTLVDVNGFLYDYSYFGRAGTIETGDLAVGASRQGWVTFTITDGVQLESIKYYDEIEKVTIWAGVG
jgi:hypothetical protein